MSVAPLLCQRSMQTSCRLGSVPFQGRKSQVLPRRSISTRASSEPILRKPEAPAVKADEDIPQVSTKTDETHSSTTESKVSGVTIEYQRAQAKALQQYFRDLNAQKTAEKAQFFGWTRKNEVTNGRWVMFGIFVGLLTEYATGVDFVNQLKLLVSYLGIADIYD